MSSSGTSGPKIHSEVSGLPRAQVRTTHDDNVVLYEVIDPASRAFAALAQPIMHTRPVAKAREATRRGGALPY